jgi:amidase
VAIFDVIADCDPADPVTAASQGKRADSYLRFLDKDGARGARLAVVHQLFTSEDADPGAMARNVSGSRRQGRAAAVGSVKGRSPAPTGTGKMRRKRTLHTT